MVGLLQAHPVLGTAGKNLPVLVDDGTYPKLTGLEQALTTGGPGLALVVWRLETDGLVDTSKDGVSVDALHLAVVIHEAVTVNRGPSGSGVDYLHAVQYVREALQGQPRGAPPGTAILAHSEPISDFGTNNGVRLVVCHFTKQHRITPL